MISFCEDFAAVKLNGKWGYTNKVGKEICPFEYDDVDEFYEGFSAVKMNSKWGYI